MSTSSSGAASPSRRLSVGFVGAQGSPGARSESCKGDSSLLISSLPFSSLHLICLTHLFSLLPFPYLSSPFSALLFSTSSHVSWCIRVVSRKMGKAMLSEAVRNHINERLQHRASVVGFERSEQERLALVRKDIKLTKREKQRPKLRTRREREEIDKQKSKTREEKKQNTIRFTFEGNSLFVHPFPNLVTSFPY